MSTDSHQPMRWHVDPNHCTSEAGDLNVLFGLPNSRDESIENFGVRLDHKTIGSHLARIRLEREKWRAAFQTHVAQMKALADEIPDIKVNNASCD